MWVNGKGEDTYVVGDAIELGCEGFFVRAELLLD